MISDELLEILRCPVTRTRLRPTEQELLDRLNHAIGRGLIRNRANCQVEEALAAGLTDEARSLVYAVSNGIPCLLAEEAIELAQLESLG